MLAINPERLKKGCAGPLVCDFRCVCVLAARVSASVSAFVCMCVLCVHAHVLACVTCACTAPTPGKAAKGGDSRSISDKPPLCGPLLSQRKMQKVFLHQEESGDPLSARPHGGAPLPQMEGPRPAHPARPSTHSAPSLCPTQASLWFLENPSLTLLGALAAALSLPGHLSSPWVNPAFLPGPESAGPSTEGPSPTA